jgi:hypothetical protein
MGEATLAERVQRVEDREAIRDLCSRYSLHVDNHEFDALGALFAPDARYGWVDQPPQAEGQAAIRALLESRIGPSGPSFHVNHDMMVEWGTAKDRAKGIVCCHAEVCPGGRHYLSAIRYHDQYVRIDGRWLFAERFLGFLYFTPPSEYEGILMMRERMRIASAPRPAHWPAFAV